MKHLVLLLTSLLIPVLSAAQEGLVAALYHGDSFKVYYSETAFKNAMADAVNGDIITLSPGVFKSATINKAVTIRGAGVGALDTIHEITSIPTIINGNSSGYTKIDVPADVSDGYSLSIEGISFAGGLRIENLSNSIISKCKFDSSVSSNSSSSVIENVSMVQCIFASSVEYISSIYNSVFMNGTGGYGCDVTNSIICIKSYYSGSGCTFRNCIFVSDYKNESVSAAYAYNCIFVGPHSTSGAFGTGANTYPERKNFTVPEDVEVFVPGSFYELTAEGKKYLGLDGTEVGIYGSKMPFSTKTSYPQIKKFVVAPESTADGKLKIEFELQ